MNRPEKGRPARGAAHRVRTGNRTLVACICCKERKLRCDEKVPACSNCQRNGLVCLVEDPVTKRHQPRHYVELLEQRNRLLEEELRDARTSRADPSSPSINDQNTPHTSQLAQDDERPEVDALSSMIGTLSLNAAGSEPSYLGSSSAFAFARFMNPFIRQSISPSPPTLPGPDFTDTAYLPPEPCLLPNYHMAVQLSNAYFQNIHPQYPFLHEPTFRMWEAGLGEQSEGSLCYEPGPLYFLNMVYAIGALLLPNVGCSAERLYVSAMLYIDPILGRDNLECIQAILCCAAYSLRSAKGTSHWKLGGQALRQCVNLGYHRNQKRLKLGITPMIQELQKRAFWSAYVIECSSAVMLGRPLSLHFEEIDAEFPRELEEFLVPIPMTQNLPSASIVEWPGMIEHSIHGFRIRSFFGRVQTTLYSNRMPVDPNLREASIQHLADDLEIWRASCPTTMVEPVGGALSFFVTPDWHETSYDMAVMHLHRTQITNDKQPASDEVFLKCLNAAGRICRRFRRLYIGKPLAYTWGGLHELFLAGLTYLYCLWMSPGAQKISRPDQVSGICTDCTMVLVILAERWADAAPFRDIFETLASRTMTMMVSGPRTEQSSALTQDQTTGSEDFSQWLSAIADADMSTELDSLLSGLLNETSSREQWTT